MTFKITSESDMRPHMPKALLDGYASTRSLDEIFESRAATPEKDDMWDPGQTKIGRYFLAPFQRPAVWTQEQKVRLVESMLLGISIGSIVIVDALNMKMQNPNLFAKTDRWLIDGQQRLTAIQNYLQDDITVFAGTECEHKFSDLNEIELRRVRQIGISVIRIHTIDEQLCRVIYDRLNFGGTPHTEDQKAIPLKSA
jgi:hypothetical protein